MNNKYLLGFCLIFIFIISCSCVSALEQHNFGGDFTMKIPNNSNFEKLDSDLYGDLPFEETCYVDEKNIIVVDYINDPMISDDNVDCNYDVLFTALNPDLDECIEYMDGNIKVMEPKKQSDKHPAVVGIHQDNKTVILVGHNADTLKDMIQTVEFK